MNPRANQSPQSISLTTKERSAQGSLVPHHYILFSIFCLVHSENRKSSRPHSRQIEIKGHILSNSYILLNSQKRISTFMIVAPLREDRGGVVIWWKKCWHNFLGAARNFVWKFCLFREILVQRRGRGQVGLEKCGQRATKGWMKTKYSN